MQIIFIAICSSLSGLLFGYDAGIISGALLFIKKTYNITSSQCGWLVAMVPFGALIACIFSGKLSDVMGRKITLLFTATFFILGSLFCIVSNDVNNLIIGRLMIGLAIGIGSCVSPVYTSELASEQQRGWLVNLYVVSVQLGVFLSFLCGYLLSQEGNWREMIGIGIVPAIILSVAIFFLPESPRWLVIKNKTTKAFDILSRLYGEMKASTEIENIKQIITRDTINLRKLLEEPRFFKVIVIGIAISFFTQTVGINAFNYYAPTIFQSTGFATPSKATFYTLFLGLMLVLSTLSSLFFIDRVGRRKPLLWGTAGILLVLLSIALGFEYISNPILLAWTFFICAILFMALHGISIGPACFLIPAEIFPSRFRGLGMGISVAFNWGANVAIAALIPSVINLYGIASLFSAFFVITMVAWFTFYLIIPETKGTTLEQIEQNTLANFRSRDLGNQI